MITLLISPKKVPRSSTWRTYGAELVQPMAELGHLLLDVLVLAALLLQLLLHLVQRLHHVLLLLRLGVTFALLLLKLLLQLVVLCSDSGATLVFLLTAFVCSCSQTVQCGNFFYATWFVRPGKLLSSVFGI